MANKIISSWLGNEDPEFDQTLADSYIGKYILVGLTYLDKTGNFLERVQLHGVIETASPKGIQLQLKGLRDGQTFNLPPDLSVIEMAEPGYYRLNDSDEGIDNPDLLARWTITKPSSNEPKEES